LTHLAFRTILLQPGGRAEKKRLLAAVGICTYAAVCSALCGRAPPQLWQFGYRFSLDLMTPVLVLLGAAAGPWVGRRMYRRILRGVVVNAWGTWWFQNPRFF
jgi:hypothetical protein